LFSNGIWWNSNLIVFRLSKNKFFRFSSDQIPRKNFNFSFEISRFYKKILQLVAKNVERCLSYLPSYFFNSQIWLCPLMEDCHFSYMTKLWKTNSNEKTTELRWWELWKTNDPTAPLVKIKFFRPLKLYNAY
jgi:hypothetical protein